MLNISWKGQWIWSPEPLPARNAWVQLRRRFTYDGGAVMLHLTADSRYTLTLNGELLGQGPARAWPNHYRFDSYDLAPQLRAGENVLCVLVNHFGEGNFQYLPAPPGLLAQLELQDETICSDDSWRARPDFAMQSAAPRISVQQGFEEQFDARESDDWTLLDYDDSAWKPAAMLRGALDGPHQNLEARGIPALTSEAILPSRVVSIDKVRSLPHRFTIYAKPYLAPGDLSSNFVLYHAYLATQIHAPHECEVAFVSPHKHPGAIKINGEPARNDAPPSTELDPARLSGEMQVSYAVLHQGWNEVLVALPPCPHITEFTLCIDGPPDLRFSARGVEDAQSDSPWAIIGPFAPDEAALERARNDRDAALVVARAQHSVATAEWGQIVWRDGKVADLANEPYFQLVRPEHLPAADVFVQACTDLPVEGEVKIENIEALLSGTDWVTVLPPEDGSDARVLLDFGRELNGFHRFEIFASEGTVLDCHNFEFIQPDGRINLAEGMNNSWRYTCREGFQSYQTQIRRGFTYSYLLLRQMSGPVKLRRVETLFSSYPQSRCGHFHSSDTALNEIWRVGAHTLRLCAEDTYTDCPSYEQTHWVGDARNEALIDWAINGDPRLWFRCLEQAAHSLERSPFVESHVPSAWQNILPAWSFLWMRSCREYLLWTGDWEGAARLFPWVERQVSGLEAHLDERGLFAIRAWNMFDWAAMDTPSVGVVTHNNCFAVHALRDVADLADQLGKNARAAHFRAVADDLSRAINAHLWNEEKSAYPDCLRGEKQSEVFSQQTQTVAFMAGVASDFSDERAARCREMIHHLPDGFVAAGSPFFEFFLLEAYAKEARDADFLATIRRDWGFMIDQGATTFWEMWSGRSGRLTRSHCHGWSAAPTFFLSCHVLGVRPGGAGFSPVIIEPHPGDLKWCRGRVPTPRGDVEVQWENDPNAPFELRIQAPFGVEIEVRLPREGTAVVNGVAVEEPIRAVT